MWTVNMWALYLLFVNILLLADQSAACGQIKIVGKAFVGRNVTLRFIPDAAAILEDNRVVWRVSSTYSGGWHDVTPSSKYIQYREHDAFVLLIVRVTSADVAGYYVKFNAGSTYICDTLALTIPLKALEECGHLYLRSTTVGRGSNLELGYFPPDSMIPLHGDYTRDWIGPNTTHLTMDGVHFTESALTNHEYVLTIINIDVSMNGDYRVRCTSGRQSNKYTNAVPIEVHEAPNVPVLWPLQDLDGCTGCLTADENQRFDSFCNVTGGTLPLRVDLYIDTDRISTFLKTGGMYYSNILVLPMYHLGVVRCAVTNKALDEPREQVAKLYVIKQPSAPILNVPHPIRADTPEDIRCTTTGGRPAPSLMFTVGSENVTTSAQHRTEKHGNTYTSTVTLTTVMRAWNGQYVRCCLVGAYLRYSTCSHENQKHENQIYYIYPPDRVELLSPPEPSRHRPYHTMPFSCTVYRANPVCNVSWSLLGTDMTMMSVMFSGVKGNLVDGYTISSNITVNVTRDESQRQFLQCTATCTQFTPKPSKVEVLLPAAVSDEDTLKGDDGSSSDTVVLVLIVVAAILLIVIIALICVAVIRRLRNNKQNGLMVRSARDDREMVRIDDGGGAPAAQPLMAPDDEIAYAQINKGDKPNARDVTYAQVNKGDTADTRDVTYAKVNKGPDTKNSLGERKVTTPKQNESSDLIYAEMDIDHLNAASAASQSQRLSQRAVSEEPTEYVGINFAKTCQLADEEAVYANQ